MQQSTAIQQYSFTVEQAINEWLYRKFISKSGSQKTQQAYKDTINSLRDTLQRGGLDLLSDPTEVARVAAFWAAQREPESRHKGDVADSTYNQRLAIISSWYSFVRKVYRLDIENPISKDRIDKRRVQAYAYAQPMNVDDVRVCLDGIDRSTPLGLRDYALLSIGFMTGRRASELIGLCWGDVKRKGSQTILEFRCKGRKIKRDALDPDTEKALFAYVETVYGKDLSTVPAEAPIWLSFSRYNPREPITTRALNLVCQRILGTTKIHTLRHTFAKAMEKSGATLTEIQSALGHEDIATTARYLKELGSEQNVHAEKLARSFGIRK